MSLSCRYGALEISIHAKNGIDQSPAQVDQHDGHGEFLGARTLDPSRRAHPITLAAKQSMFVTRWYFNTASYNGDYNC